jgi:MoxR-like ATPase
MSRRAVKIGLSTAPYRSPSLPSRVPKKYARYLNERWFREHLEWLFQKDALTQDAFLIGPPGGLRRHLAFSYCELTNRSYEIVSLSKETTDADLKQRREIVDSTAVYVDQPPVKAALDGSVLILDGIEKAERNVLPILNNLLENREMGLSDGRFLVAPERYDALAASMTPEELRESGLERVHPEFQIIALGLPVPTFPGFPLDPPLRSRFQARLVDNPSGAEQLATLHRGRSPAVSKLVAFSETIAALRSHDGPLTGQGVHHLPFETVEKAAQFAETFPNVPLRRALATSGWPYQHFGLDTGQADVLETALAQFFPTEQNSSSKRLLYEQCPSSPADIVRTPEFEAALADLDRGYKMGWDLCIVGGAGSGKSTLAQLFGSKWRTRPSVVVNCYRDMSSRDLLLRRSTDYNGNTVWEPSPLLTAAIDGRLVVLDGIHRLEKDTLGMLHSLLCHREIDLADGRRLVRHDRIGGVIDDVQAIHPSFRVLALANPPIRTGGALGQQDDWLSSEVLTMFGFVDLPKPSSHSIAAILGEQTLVSSPSLGALLAVSERLDAIQQERQEDADITRAVATLSLRQIKRIWKSLCSERRGWTDDDRLRAMAPVIERTLMSRFMPTALQEAVVSVLTDCLPATVTIDAGRATSTNKASHFSTVRIGGSHFPVTEEVEFPELIPSTLFFDIPAHVAYLETIANDLHDGERWQLLIGNQGTGKNKLVDRLLYLLQWPREYMQLHRDTSVQSLTTVPTIVAGKVLYEDSPLVKAVQNGHVLVIDEADKAPTEVVCILKSLIEDGQMMLSDGRQLLSPDRYAAVRGVDGAIKIHPNFKMIALANRPGFPFLGNDFFREAGDCFSTFVIENPPRDSQLALLQLYSRNEEDGMPGVPEALLDRLVSAFEELDGLHQDGTLLYPYSTREMVHIVQHMKRFPSGGISRAIANVLDFDRADEHVMQVLVDVFQKHGIPLLSADAWLGTSTPTADRVSPTSWSPKIDLAETSTFSIDSADNDGLRGRSVHRQTRPPLKTTLTGLSCKNVGYQFAKQKPSLPLSVASQASVFSEEKQWLHVDLLGGQGERISRGPSGGIQILVSKPHGIVNMDLGERAGAFIDLSTQYSLGMNYEIGAFGKDHVFLALNEGVAVRWPCTNDVDQIAAYLDEEFFGKTSKRVTWMDVRRRITEGRLIDVSCAMLENDGVAFAYEGNKVLRIEFDPEQLRKVTSTLVDFSGDEGLLRVTNIFPLSRRTMLVALAEAVPEKSAETVASLQYRLVHLFDAPASNATQELLEFDHAPDNEPLVVHGAHYLSESSFYIVGSPQSKHGVDHVVSLDTNTYSALHPALPSWVDHPDRVTVVKSIQAETTVATLYEYDGGWPFLRVVDFDRDTLRHLQLHDGMDPDGRRTPENRDHVAVDIAFVGSSVDSDSPPDVAVLYDDGVVRVLQVDTVALLEELQEFQEMAGGSGDHGTNSDEIAIEMISVDDLGHESLVTVSAEGDWMVFEGDRLDEGAPDRGLAGPDGGDGSSETSNAGANAAGSGTSSGSGGSGGIGGFGSGGSAGSGGGGGGGGGADMTSNSFGGYNQASMEKLASVEDTSAMFDAINRALEITRESKSTLLHSQDVSNHGEYDRLLGPIKQEITQMRVVLESAEAKENEREWLGQQLQGDLDDNRLVDSVTGERRVYRKRGTPEKKAGLYQGTPKRLVFAVDVSASMARLNNWDGRLDRMVQATILMMEALSGFNHKFDYAIVGHSGVGPDIPLVEFGNPPTTREEKVDVVNKIFSASRGATTGDSSLLAAQLAIKAVVKEKGDDYLVFLFSDANLGRYGISPAHLTEALTSKKSVQGHAIFLAEAAAAEWLAKEMPWGRGFVAMDLTALPKILKTAFENAVVL